MDGWPTSISPHELYSRIGTGAAPVLIDVQREDAFGADVSTASAQRIEFWIERRVS
jgi:hypothetical protein